MARQTLDPDQTRQNDAAYWGAALVIALQNGDRARAAMAQRRLRQLGLDLILRRRPQKQKAR